MFKSDWLFFLFFSHTSLLYYCLFIWQLLYIAGIIYLGINIGNGELVDFYKDTVIRDYDCAGKGSDAVKESWWCTVLTDIQYGNEFFVVVDTLYMIIGSFNNIRGAAFFRHQDIWYCGSHLLGIVCRLWPRCTFWNLQGIVYAPNTYWVVSCILLQNTALGILQAVIAMDNPRLCEINIPILYLCVGDDLLVSLHRGRSGAVLPYCIWNRGSSSTRYTFVIPF